MDLPIALHTAARAFCANQHFRWSAEYMPLVESGRDRVGSDYSKAAYSLFPRYRLDEAIEVEVERITGHQFPSLEDARKLLLEGGNRAFSSLLQEFQRSPQACVALTDEWRAFEAHISGLDPVQLARIEALPYRRVLTKSESEHLRQKLSARWGANGYWYPIAECDPQTNVIAFHQELWEQRDGTSLLLQAIRQRAIERCFLLLEGPVDYEIARSLVEPMYRRDESFVTSDFEWLMYISHESSIAVAGWLADFFRKRWQDWEAVTYGGPFHTADLRGSWGVLKR
ncbi:MAG: hypothetical protein ABSG34_21625 [Candidatus Sulfotelmatobacter sp.]|jgi:hypothetical protein